MLAWGGVMALSALALEAPAFRMPLVVVAVGGGTAGLAVAIVGAARHERI